MRYKYKCIDLNTADGFKRAEKLKENGWKLISSGFNTVTFEKEEHEKEN